MMYILSAVFCVYLCISAYCKYEDMKTKKKEASIKELRTMFGFDLNISDSHIIIDQYIEEELDAYILESAITQEVTINQEEENNINRTISINIARKLPQSVYNKLGFYYNTNELIDIINHRILLYVAAYRIEHNMVAIQYTEVVD